MVWRTAVHLLVDVVRFVSVSFRSRSQLAAENLFLRKQLALYRERQVKPRRADDATRITLVMLSQLIDWRAVLTIVQPATLIRWHRKGFRLFWRWKSRAPGRPLLAVDVQQLIAAMARANATWGEERIAAELRLKLGLCVSPRTVRRYMPLGGRPRDVCRPSGGAPSCATTPRPYSPATWVASRISFGTTGGVIGAGECGPAIIIADDRRKIDSNATA